MIQVDPEHIDYIRTMQEMLLQTRGGELMLAVLMEEGHINAKIENDQQRIEHNLARRILEGCGIELVAKQADLVPLMERNENVIENILNPQGDEHE